MDTNTLRQLREAEQLVYDELTNMRFGEEREEIIEDIDIVTKEFDEVFDKLYEILGKF